MLDTHVIDDLALAVPEGCDENVIPEYSAVGFVLSQVHGGIRPLSKQSKTVLIITGMIESEQAKQLSDVRVSMLSGACCTTACM